MRKTVSLLAGDRPDHLRARPARPLTSMTTLLERLARLPEVPRRPRAVWAAFITSLIVSIAIVAGVLVPVLGLIGAAAGASAGTLHVPVSRITLALLIGYALALALLAACIATKHGPIAWVAGVAAIISTLLVSVWPLAAFAFSAVGEVRQVVPFIEELLARVLPR